MFPRSRWLFAATLLFLSGCEPDECHASLRYKLGNLHQLEWSSPATQCAVYTTGLESYIAYTRDDGELTIITTAGLTLGTHDAALTFTDTNGKKWASLATSKCTIAIVDYEFVEWMNDNHHRLEGVVVCGGPLHEVSEEPELGGAQLHIQNINLAIYAGREL